MMKKTIITIILIFAIFLVGCQDVTDQNDLPAQSDSDIENNQNNEKSNPDTQITSNPNSNDKTPISEPLPSQSIEVQGLEQLNEMREMLTCNDETRVEQYIQSVANSGVQSKDDLFAFVKTIDSLPHIPILDGNITWICFSHSISEDTGKETNVVYITTEAANGDWTRVEYVLSVTDVSQKISDEKVSVGNASILNSPVKNSEGTLTIHVETRSPHPSEKGTMIQWVGDVDGIFTRIYYFTNNTVDVETRNLFGNIQISTISECAHTKPQEGDRPILTFVSKNEYAEFLSSNKMPDDFVSYDKIDAIGTFYGLVFLSDAYSNDYSEYMYSLIDPEGIEITLYVDHNQGVLSTSDSVSNLRGTNMRMLSDTRSGVFAYDGLTYRYVSGELLSISWETLNVNYTLCGAGAKCGSGTMMLSNYPITKSTFVGKLLDTSTALQAFSNVFDVAIKPSA